MELIIKALSSSVRLLITILSLFINSTCSHNVSAAPGYNLCLPFQCGNLTFPFPFSSVLTFGLGPENCGLPGYQIACDVNEPSFPSGIIISGRLYKVKNVFLSERLITVVDIQLIQELMAGSCNSLHNLTLASINTYYNDYIDIPSLSLPSWVINLSLVKCPIDLILDQEFLGKVVSNFSCSSEGNVIYLWQDGNRIYPSSRLSAPLLVPNGCDLIRVPASYGFLNGSSKHRIELVDVLADGFPLTWPAFNECNSCNATGGRCGFDGNKKRIVCFQYEQEKLKQYQKWKKWEVTVGVAAGCSAILIIYLAIRNRILKIENQNTTGQGINARKFIRTYRSGLLTNYTYNDLKKMTKGFKEKLGEGGCGNVYKGKLPDGRLVAVKLLGKSNNFGHDFVNEVAAIGRIHHVNVISLLGFSCYCSRQAIIYEFMPNGSLADLLSNEEYCVSLGLVRMLEIAIGIAHGIEYLHNGCESRILHLDIKPQNVLLDQNLNPKISDFGLAKVYSRSQSAVSMTSAKGTIGYIAPEIFMKNFGNASHKSDVYSFGMLLLEMVQGKNHVDDITNSSEVYFPSSFYKLIEEKNLESLEFMAERENENIVKKMIMVGLWCIQINPKDRPSMTRVLEMLTGHLNAIEMPPKPFLFSPPARVQHEINIASIESDISDLSFTSNTYEGAENS